jgi:hypothetical protein
MAAEPKTLQGAILYFADQDNCLNYLVARRWPHGVVCPRCGSINVGFVASRRIWQCKTRHDHAQFSIKTGTIFEDSPISLDKWLLAMWMLANCKNGVSSYEIHRATGITQKSCWFMLQRIRLALQGDRGGKLAGEVEVDETFIGGKARNMHKDVKARRIQGKTGGEGKAIVMGLLERQGHVRARVINRAEAKVMQGQIREHVAPGTQLFTDEHQGYRGMPSEYEHSVVNHAEEYVRGNVHTNGLENFWSLLKRGIAGTYISVEPFHLFRYVDEQAFRYNYRSDVTDSDRFSLAVSRIVGKRLTWAEVTGKVSPTCSN